MHSIQAKETRAGVVHGPDTFFQGQQRFVDFRSFVARLCVCVCVCVCVCATSVARVWRADVIETVCSSAMGLTSVRMHVVPTQRESACMQV